MATNETTHRTNQAALVANNLLACLFREQLPPDVWRPALDAAIALLPVKLAELPPGYPFPAVQALLAHRRDVNAQRPGAATITASAHASGAVPDALTLAQLLVDEVHRSGLERSRQLIALAIARQILDDADAVAHVTSPQSSEAS